MRTPYGSHVLLSLRLQYRIGFYSRSVPVATALPHVGGRSHLWLLTLCLPPRMWSKTKVNWCTGLTCWPLATFVLLLWVAVKEFSKEVVIHCDSVHSHHRGQWWLCYSLTGKRIESKPWSEPLQRVVPEEPGPNWWVVLKGDWRWWESPMLKGKWRLPFF